MSASTVELAATLDAHSSQAIEAAPEIPRRIGRFVIVDRIGAGGMGQVFSAYDPELDRRVALKLLLDLREESPVAVARVKQEAQAMARVSHPNVVHVYEAGEADGRVFIAMQFVDGPSLAEWQRRRERTAPGETTARLRAYLQAAAGLVAAHRCGLIHRDFKPDNVLVGNDGRVCVADFGLARLIAGLAAPQPAEAVAATSDSDARPPSNSGPRLTHAGAILGTPGYMSPEQVRGVEADERSDQFSFCAALYESLYGQQPYAGHRLLDYAGNVLTGSLRPPPPSDVPVVVERALLRGLSVDPSARFPSMEALIAALERGLAPESEPGITRADRVRFGVTVFAALALIEVLNALAVTLTRARDSLVRAAVVAAVLLALFATMAWRPPRAVRHRARYRRMMAFVMVVAGTFFFGRLAGAMTHMPAASYFTLEAIALAALCMTEAIRIGWRHAVLGVVMLAYAPFVQRLPHLRVLVYNALLVGIAVSSVYLHLQQRPDASDG